jgi:hypothetical protein
MGPTRKENLWWKVTAVPKDAKDEVDWLPENDIAKIYREALVLYFKGRRDNAVQSALIYLFLNFSGSTSG